MILYIIDIQTVSWLCTYRMYNFAYTKGSLKFETYVYCFYFDYFIAFIFLTYRGLIDHRFVRSLVAINYFNKSEIACKT